jgi:two-component system sensor histidine kinase KdpD
MSQELAATRSTRNLASIAAEHLHGVFDATVALLLDGPDGQLHDAAAGEFAFSPRDEEREIVDWLWVHDKPGGLGTDTLPGAKALYLPLRGAQGRVGVLGVIPADPRRFGDVEQRARLDVFAGQIASSLERARLAELAQQAHVQVEAERLRSALLSSVSHDLRTPLSVITGAASALVQTGVPLDAPARQDLSQTILEESRRLNRLVRNLLDMTRLSSGVVRITKEWQPVEGIVGAVLGRLEEHMQGRAVETDLPADLPLVPVDGVLLEQLLTNLLENAVKYSPERTPVAIRARRDGNDFVMEVADRGPGVPPELAQMVFEKFYRAPGRRDGGGAGLGLAICRAIVEAHGGRIWVEPRPGGGAAFRFALPIEGAPPVIALEETA